MSWLFIVVLLCYYREVIAEPSDSESILFSSIGCQKFNESHSCDYSRLNDQECERGQEADRFVFIITDITPLWGPLQLTPTASRMDMKLWCISSYDLNDVIVSQNARQSLVGFFCMPAADYTWEIQSDGNDSIDWY